MERFNTWPLAVYILLANAENSRQSYVAGFFLRAEVPVGSSTGTNRGRYLAVSASVR